MEAGPVPSKTRYLVFVAVAGIHAVLVGVLISESRALRLSSSGGTPLTAFIVMRPVRLHTPFMRPSLNESSAPITPMVEPITVTPPATTRASGHPIDWKTAGSRAAARVLVQRKRITFGFPPGGKSAITLGVPSLSTPAHHAGESYRTPGGEETEWISERCYIVSDPPLPGGPDFLKNARVTRSGCLPPPGPDPGELFRSLPAYKKLHPKE